MLLRDRALAFVTRMSHVYAFVISHFADIAIEIPRHKRHYVITRTKARHWLR